MTYVQEHDFAPGGSCQTCMVLAKHNETENLLAFCALFVQDWLSADSF